MILKVKKSCYLRDVYKYYFFKINCIKSIAILAIMIMISSCLINNSPKEIKSNNDTEALHNNIENVIPSETPLQAANQLKNTEINNKIQTDDNLIIANLNGTARALPIYGFNGNNTNGLAWTIKSFRDTAASLGLKAIRYPGGAEANLWDWQAGWFEKKGSSPVLLAKQQMRYSPSGLKELKTLVDQTGCDVFFVLNMLSRNVNDQIEMLKNAQSLGIPVKFIELGNELNLKKSVGKSVFETSSAYGKACNEWISKIKSSFPQAKIAVVGGNLSYNDDVKNWNNTVLQLAPEADAVVAHVYGAPDKFIVNSMMNFEKLGQDFTEKYNKMGFQSIKGNKEIWMTEYNIQWSGNDEGASKEQSEKKYSKVFTWGQSLTTLYLTSLITGISEKIKVILDHNIAGAPMFAAIAKDKNGYKKLPNGIGMEIWLSASKQMNSLNKINFSSSSQNSIQNYDLFGWKFNNVNSSNVLLVNLTNHPNSINLANIINTEVNYETKYADINKVINAETDIKIVKGKLNGKKTIELPPYSATILKK
jgi:hypothetical protein